MDAVRLSKLVCGSRKGLIAHLGGNNSWMLQKWNARIKNFDRKLGEQTIRMSYGTASRGKKTKSSILKQFLKMNQDMFYEKHDPSSKPVAAKKNVMEVVFGHHIEDNYRYLNNIQANKSAQKYLIDEENYCRKYSLEHLGSFKSVFEKELKDFALLDNSPIRYEKIGQYYYYSERVPDFLVGRLCRKLGLDGEGKVVLDFAALKMRYPKLQLAPIIKISGDNNLIAYGIEIPEKSMVQIQVCEIDTNYVLDSIMHVGNCEFDRSGRYIFFTLLDEFNRAYRVARRDYLHSMSQRIIYEERDPAYQVELSISKDKKYFFIKSVSLTSVEVRYFSADDEADPRLLFCKSESVLVNVDYCNKYFYILENTVDGESRFYVIPESEVSSLDRTPFAFSQSLFNVKEFGVSNYGACLIQHVLGRPQIIHVNPQSGRDTAICLPTDLGYLIEGNNYDETLSEFQVLFSNPFTPIQVYSVNLETFEVTLTHKHVISKPDTVRRGFAESDYVVDHVLIKNDGVDVPLTLFHKKDIKYSSDNPTLLMVDGGFNKPTRMSFEMENIPLLMRGWVLAYAHVRGSGDKNIQWFHDGKGINKKNAFSDLNAVVEYLFEKKITNCHWLIGKGSVHGGLCLTQLANERELAMKAMVLYSPIVDIIGSFRNELYNGVKGLESEFGNPFDQASFDRIHSYDPYLNLKPMSYPAVMIISSPSNLLAPTPTALRYVAKLRSIRLNDSPILFKLEYSPNFSVKTQLDLITANPALEIAFMYHALGLFPERI